jgi:hypothetical protein
MKCRSVVRSLSAYLDGDLAPPVSGAVAAHLAACPRCEDHSRSLREAIESVADLAPLVSPEPIAARVFDRLEVESRGPGLALVFRPSWAARPLFFPSLVPAALVLLTVLTAGLALGRSPDSWSVVTDRLRGEGAVDIAGSGTEANPLFPSDEVALPRYRGEVVVPEKALTAMAEGTLFLRTVVARDGRVSNVTVLDGDWVKARAVVDALRQERFEPVLLRGRPVAVSVYRLISRMEVRAPIT